MSFRARRVYHFVIFMAMTGIHETLRADPQDEVRQLLSSWIDSNRTPGVQYIIADSQRIIFEFNAGLADVDSRRPVTAQTTFNGYSITKTFTAAAVVKLAMEGKIELDAPIKKYLPRLPYTGSPTVRQTLQHTAGFPNPNPLPWIHLAADHDSFDEQTFIKQVIANNTKLKFEPGSRFMYSNVGYLMLGQLVATVSGRSFEDYVMQEIIAPLALTGQQTISFRLDRPHDHAYGYIRKWHWLNFSLGFFIDRQTYLTRATGGWTRFNHLMVNGKAYGGLAGNSAGFVRYLQAILQRKAPFSEQLVQNLWQVGTTNTNQPVRTALSWFHGSLDGKRYFMHSGGAGGYYCEMRIYPDINRVSMIMTNNTGISSQGYLDIVDRYFLK
ncbi:MAG: beta-lactamase family protein [Gammaproteobacteria bacterium]|nr:beta-lactamase family protein [Gammaproteobacteria bacterium]MDH5653596.1 beta-lactamase family protein [Gammaproteobacteria bacterium]